MYSLVRRKGLLKAASRRIASYHLRFKVNNPLIGRAVELLGNRVRIDGMTFSVDCAQITRPHKSTLAFGLHEIDERKLIKRWLPDNLPVLELGGGLGVVSCLINRRLLNPVQHIVVEADPAMIPVLEQNRNINGCKFKIFNKAIAYDCEKVDINVDTEFVGTTIVNRTSQIKTTRVAATTVSDLIALAGFRDIGIVCDIEGMEAGIIERELPALKGRVQYFLVEMHPMILGTNVVDRLVADLYGLGFCLKEKVGNNAFFARN
jgi:FkbM family methyltransferase